MDAIVAKPYGLDVVSKDVNNSMVIELEKKFLQNYIDYLIIILIQVTVKGFGR